jgi:hypothetical protein
MINRECTGAPEGSPSQIKTSAAATKADARCTPIFYTVVRIPQPGRVGCRIGSPAIDSGASSIARRARHLSYTASSSHYVEKARFPH